MKRTTGGFVGYASVNVKVRRNEPSSKGVSATLSAGAHEQAAISGTSTIFESVMMGDGYGKDARRRVMSRSGVMVPWPEATMDMDVMLGSSCT